MGAYVRGEPVQLPARFQVIDPVTRVLTPVNPATVVFTVVDPDSGTETFSWPGDPKITNPQTGLFILDLGSSNLPTGVWKASAVGTSPNVQTNDDSFTIYESAADIPAPPTGPVEGPCSQWISGEDVALSTNIPYDGNASIFDTAAYEATTALYEISGRQFNGLCERLVRPPRPVNCSCWLTGPVSYGMGPWYWTTTPWGFGGWGWYNEQGDKMGCAPMSRVKLSGQVREIVEVKIDGSELPEFDPVTGFRNWRLDKRRYLTRMDDPNPIGTGTPRFWPSCQNFSLDDDQPGTFSIRYKWGVDVTELGKRAAVEVAQQLFLSTGQGDDCLLPPGTTRVDRQGLVVERQLLENWANSGKSTGLVGLDLFLQAYCGGQRRGRKSALWSPDVSQYAQQVGVNE